MKTLIMVLVLFSAAFASADWEEQQKQNHAKKLFEASTTAQAIKNGKFVKKWPTVHFADVKRYSSTHDDCISGDKYYGGYSVICTEWEQVWENEEGDGEPGEWKKKCVSNTPVKLVKPASEAPEAVKVVFYRKVSGVSSMQQTSGKYRVGSRIVQIPNCQ